MNALLMLGLMLTAESPKEAKEAPKIEGTWAVASATQNGKDFDKLKGTTFVFKDDKLTIMKDGKDESAVVKLGTADKLRTIDIMPEGETKTLKGIYKVDGDKLTICVAREAGPNRPTEFTGKEGSDQLLIELKREKK